MMYEVDFENTTHIVGVEKADVLPFIQAVILPKTKGYSKNKDLEFFVWRYGVNQVVLKETNKITNFTIRRR